MLAVRKADQERRENEARERIRAEEQAKAEREARPLPDWAEVHREYQRKGVTLVLLWEEYKAAHPDCLQYSH